MDAVEFVRLIREAAEVEVDLVRIGTVVEVAAGTDRARVRFDGETSASTKFFVALESAPPVVDDRCLLLRAGSSWVILGALPAA